MKLKRRAPTKASYKQAAPPSWPGLLLGYNQHGPIYAGRQQSALVLGPPRSGKTSGLVIPSVWWAPGAVVSTSTKSDVLWATLPKRVHQGTCWYFDPSGQSRPPAGTSPLRWSPLTGCENWDTAVSRAHALAGASGLGPDTTEGSHWTERAEALLAPLLHAAAAAGLDISWVVRWVLRRELQEPLRELGRIKTELAGECLVGIAETDDRERSGIFSTAARLLSAYRSQAALNAAAAPNFNPDSFVTSNDTIYLVASAQEQGQLAPLVVALLDQLQTSTYRRPPGYQPTVWALDEVANIAPLPGLPAIVAEGGSQGLVTLACLQDLAQARARWGQIADGFCSLFTAKVVLGGIADYRTLQLLSALAGDVDVPFRSTSRHHSRLLHFENTVSWSIQRRPRLPISAISALRPGTALLVYGNSGVHPVTLYPQQNRR